MNHGNDVADKPLQVLVVNDSLPDIETDSGQRLMHILQALRELGHVITFIARDSKKQEVLGPVLAGLKIQVYAGDIERLPALGKDVTGSSWLLHTLLQEKQFNAAILIQNFNCGISIPEHYLDTIRASSPQTRVLILNDAIYARSGHRRAEVTKQLEHHEVAEGWFARECEAFGRSDLVIVRHANDEAWLRQNNLAVETAVVPTNSMHSISDLTWKERNGIFLNSDLSQPGDIDGLTWFLERIWPNICRGSSGLELLVTGADKLPLESRQKLAHVRWLETKGGDQAAMNARVFVAPLRFGRVPDFLVRMMCSGIPGVVSSYAAESANMKAGAGIVIANTPEEFSTAVLQLYKNQETWKNLSAQGALSGEEYTWDQLKGRLQDALVRAQNLKPKPAASTPFSMTEVDSLYGETLGKTPRERRVAFRLDGHVQLAQELLRTGRPAEARAQLRHVFSWLGESVQFSAPLARLLSVLARCYRELGDSAAVERCAQRARRCFCSQVPTKAGPASTVVSVKGTPQISLIVPTFNRLPILKKCLAALEAQTFAAKDFEVIVIDDGSSDGTEAMMRQYQPQFHLQYLRQSNSGTGAARRNGVAHAQGKYLLLMNDDTICNPDLIEQHMHVQRQLRSERWAVLGNFEYPVEARRRAFTHFLRTGSFMFPQIDMEAGFPYPYSHFITCNLSIRRDAVLEAGSFDSTYKLSEDTELGIRLFEMGYGVLYYPAAHAWHDHLPYVVGNLIRRARVYGADYFYMFSKHPRVVREWAMPVNLTGMKESAAQAIHHYLETNRCNVEAAAVALERWENVEFEPVLEKPEEAAKVLALFQQAVPAIHWFYLLEKMLETMTRELGLIIPTASRSVAVAASGGRLG